ncbi:MAG: sugar ABC transporter permease [Anaerolineae bacterium]|nr:sugar ABC transporter permease [Anaerolineae bacterium]
MTQSMIKPAPVESSAEAESSRGWLHLLGQRDPRRFASVLILPAQLLLMAIVVFPLVTEVYISLTGWSPTRGGDWWKAYQFWDWGLNYAETLWDSDFWQAMWRTLIIVGVAVPLEFLLGLGLAFLFLEEFPGKRIFHTALLTPMMIVPAVAGYMFFMLFQGNGPINSILTMISGSQVVIPWLSNGTMAMLASIIAEVWQWTPLMFLILLSGLVGLPEDQMRAATILGASFWQKFRYLMLPMLKPVIIIALVIRFMEAIKIFDAIFLMTGGGPARATETISIFMYRVAFQNVRWSYAAASAIIILVLMTIVASYALRPLQVSNDNS